MVSKRATKRGYNRGDYIVGTYTRPVWTTDITHSGGAKGMRVDPVVMSEVMFDCLRVITDEMLMSEIDVISWTRD